MTPYLILGAWLLGWAIWAFVAGIICRDETGPEQVMPGALWPLILVAILVGTPLLGLTYLASRIEKKLLVRRAKARETPGEER